MNKRLRDLFLLGVEGKGGSGEPEGSPGGAAVTVDDDTELSEEQLKKAAEDRRLTAENQKVRTKLKVEREERSKLQVEMDALRKTQERLMRKAGVTSIDDLTDDDDPTPAATGKVVQRSPGEIKLEREMENLKKQMSEEREGRQKEKKEKLEERVVNLVNSHIASLGISGTKEVSAAFRILRPMFSVDEEGKITQSYRDDKTGDEIEGVDPSVEASRITVPESMLPAKGVSGSGGKGSREAGGVGTSDLLDKALGSQADYEKNRDKLIAAERSGTLFPR